MCVREKESRVLAFFSFIFSSARERASSQSSGAYVRERQYEEGGV